MRSNKTLNYCPELFYILGAMLGDGCIYRWKNDYQVSIVGEEEFTQKCASKLSVVTEKHLNIHKHPFRNYWWVKISHYDLFMLFEKIRADLVHLLNIMKTNNYHENSLALIEGFFDAEGCIKVVREPVRKTPKICLDITNTNYGFLELIRVLLEEHLDIVARYSIQYPNPVWRSKNKQIAYHLRIYKKEYVKMFFENIRTTKLKKEKISYLNNWLIAERLTFEGIKI
jgi:hypothetical protein